MAINVLDNEIAIPIEFKYGVQLTVNNIKDLSDVFEWLNQCVPNTINNPRWRSLSNTEVWFKHQRDRNWFMLTWQ